MIADAANKIDKQLWEKAMRSRRTILQLGVAAAASVVAPPFARAQETKLTVIVFPGMANLPILAAQSKGFFAKRKLEIDLKPTPKSDELRNGLAEGRYQIAHAGIDNSVAMVENAKVDSVIFIGGDSAFNHLIAQADIKSIADLKGKTVGVDAPNTAYAFQLYAMLKQKGLNKGDYIVKPIGGSLGRLNTIKSDKTIAATMLNVPFSLIAVQAGLKNLGAAVKVLGPYQGTGGFVLRAWAAKNPDVMVRYTQAYIEGFRWVMNRKNKDEAVALLVEKIKLAPDIAAQAYMIQSDPIEGMAKDAKFDLVGFKNVLKLRVEAEGGTLAAPEKYYDLSHYKKALAGI
jgi:ABC-type nitrate/sulfonate/bicarbonate transport system substrate-binding protein